MVTVPTQKIAVPVSASGTGCRQMGDEAAHSGEEVSNAQEPLGPLYPAGSVILDGMKACDKGTPSNAQSDTSR
jgi:hypothetical protein